MSRPGLLGEACHFAMNAMALILRVRQSSLQFGFSVTRCIWDVGRAVGGEACIQLSRLNRKDRAVIMSTTCERQRPCAYAYRGEIINPH